MQEKQIKLIGIIAVIIVILNLVLFSFTVISWQVFLVVLALAFIFVKWGLPRLKTKN
tara:strand:+ start:489 stop:659 length:171 start_codon:yes stop_codon:yes gene_type:complete